MYSHLQLLKKYVHYYATAYNGKGHGMHSPFVFDFIQSVLNNKHHYTAPATIEEVRKELLRNKKTITVEDLGAGSRTLKSTEKEISNIAKAAVKPPKYSQLLHRLVKHYQPQTIIELGTSLGITTAYLATGNSAANITTIEGSSAIAEVAQTVFKKLQLSNIQLLTGNFNYLLPEVLQQIQTLDVGYIDGNHRLTPTLNYFHQLLQKAHNHTVLIFDDIHWSAEMEEAWYTIQQHPAVRCSIDIFFLGFVFFRDEFKEKQHFAIRF